METVGASRIFAETSDTVFLIGLEVAFEPVPLGWILVIAFPCENMRGHAVEEPTVVRDHHSAAREAKQCVFKRFKSFDIKIVGRFVEQQQVAALLQGQRKIQTIAFTTGQHAGELLLVGTLETEGRPLRAGRYFNASNLKEVKTVRHGLP